MLVIEALFAPSACRAGYVAIYIVAVYMSFQLYWNVSSNGLILVSLYWKMFIIPGDLIQETTDAIVNIIGSDMDICGAGELGKAIARASGI